MKAYRVFLDAAIYIAGAGSAQGGSRQVLDWCAERILHAVTSSQVLDEARRNVAKKLPRAAPVLERIIAAVGAELAPTPTEEESREAARVLFAKDAPILAAARKAGVDVLLTLDRRHFKQPAVVAGVPFLILLPEEFVPRIRAELAGEDEGEKSRPSS